MPLLFAAAAGAKPNFLLIIADDCTYNDLPLYGGQNARTPNIQRLASEGLTFNRAYLSSSMCQPCRAELYSGLYPLGNGCSWNHSGCRPGITGMPQALGKLGYRVGLAGKRHIRPEKVFPFEKIEGLIQLLGQQTVDANNQAAAQRAAIMCGIERGSAIEHEEFSALGLKLDQIAADVSTVMAGVQQLLANEGAAQERFARRIEEGREKAYAASQQANVDKLTKLAEDALARCGYAPTVLEPNNNEIVDDTVVGRIVAFDQALERARAGTGAARDRAIDWLCLTLDEEQVAYAVGDTCALIDVLEAVRRAEWLRRGLPEAVERQTDWRYSVRWRDTEGGEEAGETEVWDAVRLWSEKRRELRQ